MRRFPHTTRTWQQAGNDGKTYRVTAKVYTAVLRSPQDVWFYMLIESPDGTRRELHGEREVRPVMERIWAERGKRVCECEHVYAEHDKWLKARPCKQCDCRHFAKTR